MRQFGQKIEENMEEMMKITRDSAEMYERNEPSNAHIERKEKVKNIIKTSKKRENAEKF